MATSWLALGTLLHSPDLSALTWKSGECPSGLEAERVTTCSMPARLLISPGEAGVIMTAGHTCAEDEKEKASAARSKPGPLPHCAGRAAAPVSAHCAQVAGDSELPGLPAKSASQVICSAIRSR